MSRYLRWLLLLGMALAAIAAPRGLAAQDVDGDVARGEQIYQTSCAMCHGTDAAGMMGMHPALTGVVERLTVEGVEVTIRNGRDTRPPMPAFGERFSDEDVGDVTAYLDSLPSGPRNFGPEMGEERPEGGGMGGMMRDMMGGVPIALWLVIVVLVAAVAGLVGYLVGQGRRR